MLFSLFLNVSGKNLFELISMKGSPDLADFIIALLHQIMIKRKLMYFENIVKFLVNINGYRSTFLQRILSCYNSPGINPLSVAINHRIYRTHYEY